jgi:hypothetical protein
VFFDLTKPQRMDTLRQMQSRKQSVRGGSAHQKCSLTLKSLQEDIGEHPEIGAAITKLELALNALAIQTGGLL